MKWIRRFCLVIALMGILAIFYTKHSNLDTSLGYYQLFGALAVLVATFIPWKSLFQSGSVGRRTVKTTHSGSNSSMFAGFGGWTEKHSLIVAGFVLATLGLLFFLLASRQEDFKIFALIGSVLILGSAGLFLQNGGGLEGVLKGWAKHGLPATGFVVFLVLSAWLAHDAYLDGSTWWEEFPVWIAVGVAFLFGLATVGKLKGFLELCGKGIALFFGILGSTLSGKHSLGLAMIMWGTLLISGGFTSVSMSKMELFEDIAGLQQTALESAKIMIGIGFFLVILSPLAFMGKKK